MKARITDVAKKAGVSIALIYDKVSPNYISHIQLGAIDSCREAGYHLVVEPLSVQAGANQEEQIKAIRSVFDRLPVDGIILTPPLVDSSAVLESLSDLNVKCVRVSPKSRGQTPFVGMDDKTAAYQMTQYLLEQGHEKIAFIRGHIDHFASSLREEGFLEALNEASVTAPEHFFVQGDFTFASGASAAKTLLGLPEANRPTAIFASNDDMAAAVISTAGQMGIDVPNDLSVCGFDDTPLARVIWPALTTGRQPIYKMVYQAARQLVKRHDDLTEPGQILDFEIMVRDSVAAPQ